MENEIDKRDDLDVLVALNEKGNVVLAGEPEYVRKHAKKSIMECIENGYVIKTIKFKEFKLMKWYDD